MRNLILTGGGTAGHCIPALSLIPYLEKQFDNIYYIGSQNGIEREIVAKTHVNYYSIPTVKLRRSLSATNLTIPFKLTAGVIEAERLLKKLKPSVVFSKGGYVALPVAIAAGIKKIPLILHESDMTLGLANRLSAKFAREILTSFKITAASTKKGLWTGAPISPQLFGATRAEGRAHYGIKTNKPILLVMGGSSGSVALNCVLRDILPTLTKKYHVLHLVGKGNVDKKLLYTNGYTQVEFEDQMRYAYAAADFALSRAGSNCIFELIAMKIPALLIPLPRGESRGDQIENARYFKQNGMFKMMLQEDVTPEALSHAIDEVFNGRLNSILAQQKYNNNANEAIAKRIIRASISV